VSRKPYLLLAIIICTSFFTSSALAMCYETQELLPYQVCTDWWDGTRTCHYQWGWFDVSYCEVYGGGGYYGPIYPPGGGGDPTNYPPPDCQIVGVSDENPDQPILSIQANEAVVDMTLAYDGWTNQTVNRTDTMAMQPVNYFHDGTTTVTVQCRNVVDVYSTPTMNVNRYAGVYENHDNVYGVWTVINLLGEPEDGHGEWFRNVSLLTKETSYSVATFGTRNGLYEHDAGEDSLDPSSSGTPRPAWDSTYVTNVWSGGQSQAWGWPCKYVYLPNAICFDNIGTFASPYAPNANAVITDFMVPLQNVFYVGLLQGREISVGPQ
jgi:hypothetical protein